MGFVRVTKSMEEVGKVILCTDVFYFVLGNGGGGTRVHQDRTTWQETGNSEIFENLLKLQHEDKKKIHNCGCRLGELLFSSNRKVVLLLLMTCFVLGVFCIFNNFRKYQDAMNKIFDAADAEADVLTCLITLTTERKPPHFCFCPVAAAQ